MVGRIINHEVNTKTPATTLKVAESKRQIELAAEALAQIFIQQAMSKNNVGVNKKIKIKYGKSNK